MNFSWADYLAAAVHLREFGTASGYREASLRSAISRSYYAALNTARNHLRDELGVEVPEDARIHSEVPRWFMDEDDVNRREIGSLLERLRDRRRKADYEDELRNVPSLLERSLADGQLVIRRLSNH